MGNITRNITRNITQSIPNKTQCVSFYNETFKAEVTPPRKLNTGMIPILFYKIEKRELIHSDIQDPNTKAYVFMRHILHSIKSRLIVSNGEQSYQIKNPWYPSGGITEIKGEENQKACDVANAVFTFCIEHEIL